MFNLTLLAGTVPNAADYPVPEGALDKLGYGLQVALVGMGTVFFVLFLLMFVVYIFKLVFYTIPNKKAAKNADTAVEEPVQTAAVAATDNDEEIAAVITAAIASFYENGNGAEARQKYKIRSFKRI